MPGVVWKVEERKSNGKKYIHNIKKSWRTEGDKTRKVRSREGEKEEREL